MPASLVPVAAPTLNVSGDSATTPSTPHGGSRSCRVCGGTRLTRYLNLGWQPLPNAYKTREDRSVDDRYPLVLAACVVCKLSQLTYVVPPDLLYTTYAYSSGVSAPWRAHCEALARAYVRAGMHTLDIASNDGTLVRACAAQGATAFGVEPSQSFARADYPHTTQWWSTALVPLFGATRFDLITAQNVLGHVDDVHNFMRAIAAVLAPDGVAVIEVPRLDALLADALFDTVYHEHLSYWSATALQALASKTGLVLTDLHRVAIHGGSWRAEFRLRGKPSERVTRALVDEMHDLKRATYLNFSNRVTRALADINSTLVSLNETGGYVGFGAPAKATVLLNSLDVRAYPSVVYDDTPAKQGMRVPGTHVPIEATPASLADERRPLCIFAWNYADTLIAKARTLGYTGDCLIPLPTVCWDEGP